MNIELNEQEVRFLKEFACKQYEGAKDNIETRTPIHVVERKQVEFVETEDEGESWCCDSLEGQVFDNLQDLLDAAVENYLVTQERLGHLSTESFYCELSSLEDCCSIDEQKDFLQMVSIEARFGREVISYTPVAFFLIRDEAVRYKDGYQKHNCADCRIYTYGLGYSNNGDLPVFRNLLMRMGQDLLEEKGF